MRDDKMIACSKIGQHAGEVRHFGASLHYEVLTASIGVGTPSLAILLACMV